MLRVRSDRLIRGLLLACVLGFRVGAAAAAEPSYVKDEVTLNVRSGPGSQYRILNSIRTGDAVTILDRGDGWTQIEAAGKQGWVPAGFLVNEPPARLQLETLQEQVDSLGRQLEEARAKAAALEDGQGEALARAGEHEQRLDELMAENRDLKAGARWPYLITGAALLAVGMLSGAVLRSPRRRGSRIRI